MKGHERHKLKENAFAITVEHAREALARRQRDVVWAVAVIVGLLTIVGGYAWWQQSTAGRGTELFANALAVYQAPVVPLPPPTPGGAPPVQQQGQVRLSTSRPRSRLYTPARCLGSLRRPSGSGSPGGDLTRGQPRSSC